MTKFTKPRLVNVFTYLDKLRDSGVTNMYGAGPYVMSAFDMGRDDASAIVGLWMKTFSADPPKARADQAAALQKAKSQP